MLDIVLAGFTVLVLGVHLILVNLCVAGPFVCIFFEVGDWRGNKLSGQIGRQLAGYSMKALMLGGIAGCLLGWLLWTPTFKLALEHLGSRVGYAVAEFAFSLVLIVIYRYWWLKRIDAGKLERSLRIFVLVLLATNLIYHFPFLFHVIEFVSSYEEIPEEAMTSSAFRAMLGEGEVLSRTFHFWTASFAVTGIFLVWMAHHSSNSGLDADEKKRVIRWGGLLAFVATACQFPIGFWVVTQLPASAQRNLMFGDMTTSILFWASLVVAVGLLHHLFTLARGSDKKRKLVVVSIMMATIIFLMCGVVRCIKPVKEIAPDETAMVDLRE